MLIFFELNLNMKVVQVCIICDGEKSQQWLLLILNSKLKFDNWRDLL